VTQTLFSASLIAEAVPSVWESDPRLGAELLLDLRSLSRGALAEMRTLLLELRPSALAETRLEDLLRQLGEAAAGRLGIPIGVSVAGKVSLPPEVHIAFYRIAQEALNNVVKHARAGQVQISLEIRTAKDTGQPRRLQARLLVADNGRGFDTARAPQHRLGLGIMQERAREIGAALTVDSRPGGGTRVGVLWEREEERSDE
jgi:signal transduction histidine kinase